MLNKYKAKVLSLFFLFLSVPLLETPAQGVSTIETRSGCLYNKIVVISVDNLTLSDIFTSSFPHLNYLMNKGAIGLMNTRCAKYLNPSSAYLTLGASARALGGIETAEGFNTKSIFQGEKVLDIYHRRTGLFPPPEGVVQINIAKIIKVNLENPFSIFIGGLGKTLKDAGIKCCVLGNADTNTSFHREVVGLVMDDKGYVPGGNVSKDLLMRDKSYPFGIRTDYEKLYQNFKKNLPKFDLIIIETGDLHRLEVYSQYILPEELPKQRRQIIDKIDSFLGKIIKDLQTTSFLLIIISPYPPEEEKKEGDFLTPIILYGKGIKPGLLYSGSTRNIGLITNLDFAPTILHFFNLASPPFFYGRAVKFVKPPRSTSAPAFLLKFHKSIILNEKRAGFILKGMLIYQGICVILGLFYILTAGMGKRGRKTLPIFLLLTAASLPLSLHLLPLFPILFSILLPIFFSISLYIIFKRFPPLPFISILLLTTLSLSLDIITGSSLMKFSPLGFSLANGSRFYGIGNEFMGILIFSCLIWTTFFWDYTSLNHKRLKLITALFFIFLIILIGHPKLGANVGGTITAAVSCGVAYGLLTKQRLNLGKILILLLFVFMLLSSFLLLDLTQRPESFSHLAHTFMQIKENGPTYLINMIGRKLAMNWKLIQYTVWSKIMIVCLVVLMILFFKPVGKLKQIKDKYPSVVLGFIAIGIGSAVGLIFNDSGVIVAAGGIIGITLTLLYLLTEEVK